MTINKKAAGQTTDRSPSHHHKAEATAGPGYQEDYSGRLLLSLHALRDIFSLPGNTREMESLLEGLLTPQEAEEMVKRWQLLQRLLTDEPQRQIAQVSAGVQGAAPAQYSGWLFLYGESLAALPTADAREIRALVGAGPREDLQAIRQRYEREVSPRVSGAGWRVYDGYLKANRIDAGTASYAEVVQLILGTGLR